MFVLTYGFHTPERMQTDGDSEWRYTLAISKPDQVDPAVLEPFLDTLRRALDRFEEIMNPANAHLTTDLIDSEFVAKTASVAA